MDNNENKKAPEELADESLEAVAGGEGDVIEVTGRMKMIETESGPVPAVMTCSDCSKNFLMFQTRSSNGHYFCPICGKQLW